MMAGTIFIRIEVVNTNASAIRLDYISFYTLPGSGVEQKEPQTWGAIKALYR
jgi:hypothetical protein